MADYIKIWYKDHCEGCMHVIKELDIEYIENKWKTIASEGGIEIDNFWYPYHEIIKMKKYTKD